MKSLQQTFILFIYKSNLEKRSYKLNLYFNPDRYKSLNSDLNHLNNIELTIHFIKNGIKENRRIY